ncbi:MAG: NADH-quinone oxidoreductase subunit J family protein [Gaiellales bacterium]
MPQHLTYDIVFIAATVLAIGSALGVVLSGNPFYSALALILNLVALATFYLLLQSDFVAAAQVIVYAGAVMIMFLFVTAYLGGRADEPVRDRPWYQTVSAVIAAVALVCEVVFAVGRESLPQGPVVPDTFGDPANIAQSFLARYLLAFEATSILLLIAAVGGVVLGSRRAAPRGLGDLDTLEREPVVTAPSVQTRVIDVETRFEVRPAPTAGKDGGD